MIVLCLLAAGALFYCVVNFSKRPPDTNWNPTPKTDSSDFRPTLNATPTPAEDSKPPAADTLPTPPTPAPAPADGIEEKLPGIKAQEVLERFLTAKSLAERQAIIETKTPETELAASCLAGPLPPAPIVFPEYQQTNESEQFVDFYYSVSFQVDRAGLNKQAILVRIRGGGDPKVVVDPFLDLYGGRLAKYVAAPTDKAGVFQVIGGPVATCLDPRIPNFEKKLTLKLLPCEDTKEIALAFFGRVSAIGDILKDGTHSFSYGKARACTVVLEWNTKENPEYPYLEAVQLKTLDWNP